MTFSSQKHTAGNHPSVFKFSQYEVPQMFPPAYKNHDLYTFQCCLFTIQLYFFSIFLLFYFFIQLYFSFPIYSSTKVSGPKSIGKYLKARCFLGSSQMNQQWSTTVKHSEEWVCICPCSFLYHCNLQSQFCSFLPCFLICT